MQRLTNRNSSERQEPVIQFKYIETPGSVQVVEKEVVREVPGETIIIQKEAEKVDMKPVYNKLFDLESQLMVVGHSHKEFREKAGAELEMQRRALVGLKTQRDVDRSRRLMLIRRMKKEQTAHKKTELKMKIAMGASLLIAIAALIVRH